MVLQLIIDSFAIRGRHVYLIEALESAKAAIFHIVKQVPATKHSLVLAKRFETHGESYFIFITTPGMDPTNNAAARGSGSW